MKAKSLRTVVIVALLGLAVCGPAWAADQAATSQPGRHHPFLAFLVKELNLTDDQKAKATGILETARADAQKAADAKAKSAVWKAAIENIKENVLTEPQREKLQRLHGERERHEILNALNLTDDQKAKAKQIFQTAHAAAEKAADAKTKQGIWKAALEDVRTNVLTADQREKLRQLMERREREGYPTSAPASN
jgi:Spy/CpxP family protein refolding chaperone